MIVIDRQLSIVVVVLVAGLAGQVERAGGDEVAFTRGFRQLGIDLLLVLPGAGIDQAEVRTNGYTFFEIVGVGSIAVVVQRDHDQGAQVQYFLFVGGSG